MADFGLRDADCATVLPFNPQSAIQDPQSDYSHSIVAGGLLLTS
jgi:hypothetical protein